MTTRRNPNAQQDIYNFICEFAETHNGATPAIAFIANHFDLTYVTIHNHIAKLVQRGLIKWQDGQIVVSFSQWLAPPRYEYEQKKREVNQNE